MLARALLLVLVIASVCRAAYFDKSWSGAAARVHYPTPSSTCDAVVWGVGTSMGIGGYDNLCSQVIARGYFCIIVDHNVGNMIKTDPNKFASAASHVKSNLMTWVSGLNTGCSSVSHWVMGGHSAGGQAAQNAVIAAPSLADAMAHIDPYDMTATSTIAKPAMYFGFDVTTCFVSKDKAAKKGYQLTNPVRRFFVRFARRYTFNPCGFAPKFFHCSFADSHCPMCTNCMLTPSYFHVDVANGIQKFVHAAFYGTWSKSALSYSTRTPKSIFEGSDNP